MMQKHLACRKKENILVVIRLAVSTLKNIPCLEGHTLPLPPQSPQSQQPVSKGNNRKIAWRVQYKISVLHREYQLFALFRQTV